MVQRYEQGQLASEQVGIPQADNSQSQTSALIAQAASAARESILKSASQKLSQAESNFSAAAQNLMYAGMLHQQEKRRRLVAHVSKIQDQVKFALEDQLNQTQVERINDPEQGHKDFLFYGKRTVDSALASIPENERQYYRDSVLGELDRVTLKANKWKDEQTITNLKSDLEGQLQRYVDIAPRVGATMDQSLHDEDIALIERKLPALQAAFGTEQGFSKVQKAKQDYSRAFVAGMIDTQPEQAMRFAEDFAASGLITPDEANTLRGRAHSRFKEMEAEEINRIQSESIVTKGEITTSVLASVTALEALDPLTQRTEIIRTGTELNDSIAKTVDELHNQRASLATQFQTLPDNASKLQRMEITEKIKVIDANISTLTAQSKTVQGLVGSAERQNVSDARHADSVRRRLEGEQRREEKEELMQKRIEATPRIAALAVGIANAVQIKRKDGKDTVTNPHEAPVYLDEAQKQVDEALANKEITLAQASRFYGEINKKHVLLRQVHSKGRLQKGTLDEQSIQSLIHHQEFANRADKLIRRPDQKIAAIDVFTHSYQRGLRLGLKPEEAKRRAEEFAHQKRGQ